MTRVYAVGEPVTPLSKTMTQEAINLFEKSGGKTGPSQFTDEQTARETLGTKGTVASGRMSLTFATELLRRTSGPTSITEAAWWSCASCGRCARAIP